MAAPQNKKSNQSPIVKFMPMILISVIIGYAALAYLLLFMPKIGLFLEGGEFDLKPLEARLEDEAKYLSEVEEALVQFKTINGEHIRKLGLMLPPEEDMPGLLVQLDKIAESNGMVLSSVDVLVDEAESGPGGAKTVRVAVNVAGGDYEQLLLLLNDIERLVRLADVQSISFSAGGGNYSILMRTYFLAKDAGSLRVTEEVPVQPTNI